MSWVDGCAVHRDANPNPYRALRQSRSAILRSSSEPTRALHASCWRRPRTVAIKIGHDFRAATYRAGADELRGRAAPQPGQGPRADRGGGRARRQGRLPAGTVSLALLLPVRGGRQLRPRRADSRTDHRGAERGSSRAQGRRRRFALRAPRGGHLSQHGGGDGCRRASSQAATARCTFPTIRTTTKNSTSRRATSTSPRIAPPMRRSARWYAGTSGFPRRRGWSRWRARRSFSIRPRSAGSAAKSSRCAAASSRPGRPIQRGHAIANGMFVAVANRVGAEGTAWSSGATRSWPIRSAK